MTNAKKNTDETIEKIMRRAWKTIREYALIEDGDKILIGLSGGKDSLALVEILGERMKIFKPKFTLVATHISVENIPYQSDLDFLEKHCARFGIPFVHEITRFDASTDKRRTPCFLCSWNRRKKLFEIAKRLGCNKIALGHHQDDILETLLMNLTFQGAFDTMPPMMRMDKFDMKIIRPLAMNTEKELKAFAKIRKYKKQERNCPYENKSSRNSIKTLMKKIEKINPDFRNSMWGAMSNIQENYLPQQK